MPQPLKNWYETKPEIFVKNDDDHTGLDMKKIFARSNHTNQEAGFLMTELVYNNVTQRSRPIDSFF